MKWSTSSPAIGGAITGLSVLASSAVDWVQKERAAAEAAYLGKLNVQAERRAIDLRNEYAFDPEGFDNAWKKYSETTVAAADSRYRGSVETSLGQIGLPKYGRIVDEKRSRARSQQKQTLGAMVETYSDRAIALALNGPSDSLASM